MPELRILIGFADDVTASRADILTRALLRDLKRLNVGAVRLDQTVGGAADTRGADMATVLGAIALTSASLGPSLPHLLAFLGTWVEARAQRSVNIEIRDGRVEVTGAVPPKQVAQYAAVLNAAMGENQNSADGGAA